MSNVIHLDAHRRPETPCCPRHGLLDLVDRIEERLAAQPSLLVGRDVLEDVLNDVIHTTDALTASGPEVSPRHGGDR